MSLIPRKISGTVQAITGGVRAASESFAALIGKSSGSIRAMGRQMRVIYEDAPALIRSVAPGLFDDEVDDVVARLVDDALHDESSEWNFVRYPDERLAIVRRAVRNYIRGIDDYQKSRAGIHAVYQRWRGDSVREKALSRLYAEEMKEAVERAVKHLSPAHWDTFSLVRYSDLLHAEAAERLGVSVSLVASRMSDCNHAATAVVRAYLNEGSRILPGRRSRKQTPSEPQTIGAEP